MSLSGGKKALKEVEVDVEIQVLQTDKAGKVPDQRREARKEVSLEVKGSKSKGSGS